jgi:hypothetical protein
MQGGLSAIKAAEDRSEGERWAAGVTLCTLK